ncbi:MAG TPA: tetratricopeptide repeat protein [Patescibacteria group bacterium]|nr:tetratricopeptide repeat protein [Patescibacteria group bacterium]
MIKALDTIEKYILFIVLALFPVFVLPQFASPYVVPKEILLVAGICLLVVFWLIRMVVRGSFSFSVGKFDLGVLFVAISYLLSTILATPNKMEAYLFPGVTTFALSGVVLYFLINQFDKKVKEEAKISLFAGALLLSLGIFLTTLSAFSKIPQLPAFIKDASFNPMGGNVPSGVFLIVFLAFSIGLAIKESESVKRLFFGVVAAVILFALVILVGGALPGKAQAPRFVPMQSSWEITVEALKKSPILGAGPANYLTAFNLFRPITYNQSDLWQVRFTTASNYYFTLLTENGFLGLFALAVLFIAIYRAFAKDPKSDLEKYSLVLLIVLFAVLPAAPTLLVVFFILLSLFSHSEGKVLKLNVSAAEGSSISSRIPAIIVSLPFLAGIAVVAFYMFRSFAAEATFKGALDALSRNDARQTYDLMAKAIGQNPRVDRYHASLAQVNMAIASSLGSKEDITDTDRQTITQLVQQAISEGKSTVTLNPSRSANWEVLAQIYRSIMPFATGADQFTIQAYTQAVALDPINPNLRIGLGGVYYALGRYDEAIDSFKLAVLAKGDLANAHYNLAIAYREKGDNDKAISEMNVVLSLLDANSEDYTLAKNVLTELEKNRSTEAASGTELQAPQPVEQTNITPPIELPENSTPPETP